MSGRCGGKHPFSSVVPCGKVDEMAEYRQVPRELDMTLPRWDETTRARHRRLEQQLHDGPALRLAALSLRLGLWQHRAATDDEELQQCLATIQDQLHAVVQELRDLAP